MKFLPMLKVLLTGEVGENIFWTGKSLPPRDGVVPLLFGGDIFSMFCWKVPL
jgi:hypothetical protein